MENKCLPRPKRIAVRPSVSMLFLLFCFFLFFNVHTGMVADDFIFCISRATWSRITSVREIFPALQVIYETVNGRVVPHFFAMFFLLIGKNWFNIVNALFSALLFYVLSRYLRTERGSRIGCILFLFCAIWFFLPAFGQVFLWLTGSCNYSWTMLLSFLFLLPYYLRYRYESVFPSCFVIRLLYLLLAFVTGTWSENGGACRADFRLWFLVPDRAEGWEAARFPLRRAS